MEGNIDTSQQEDKKYSLYPKDPDVIKSAIVSAKIEGINITEEELKNTFIEFHDILKQNLIDWQRTRVK